MEFLYTVPRRTGGLETLAQLLLRLKPLFPAEQAA